MPVGIIGYGTVGQATAHLFKDVVIYDPPKGYEDASALGGCSIVFLSVPTPSALDGRCDLGAVYQALGVIAPQLSDSQVVAVRSTVPPGTVRQLQAAFPNTRFASNPEFVRAHKAEEDSVRPWRVVIGGDSAYVREAVRQVYYERLRRSVPYLVTDSLTAEYIKFAANGFLATKIVYALQIRQAAQHAGADYDAVVQGLSLDPRIGGGDEWWLEGLDDECLPKDLEAFLHLLRDWQGDAGLLEAVSQLSRPEVDLVE